MWVIVSTDGINDIVVGPFDTEPTIEYLEKMERIRDARNPEYYGDALYVVKVISVEEFIGE